MRNKRKRPTDGGGNWMDTYGDMVTLLLTFFIMLFAMSNLNEQKWEVFVRSIYPRSTQEVQEQVSINSPVGNAESEMEGTLDVPETETPVDIDKLYLTLAERMNEIGIDGVTVSRGEDYTFIVFEDKTFFDGDSSILTDQGKTTLDVFCDVIGPPQDGVSQINIMAHTAQGDPDRPNNPRTDRMLSAMRAAEVCIFIQEKGIIKPEKLVNISYGQFRPVADNSTREGRTRNRRVEILMIDEGADLHSMNRYYDEYNSGVNADRTVVTGQDARGDGHGFAPAAPSADGVSTTMSPAASSADGVSAAMSPATDLPESASAEQGIPSDGTAEEAGGTVAE